MKHRVVVYLILLFLVAGIYNGASALPLPFDCSTVTDIPEAECNALVDLYNSTDGSHWAQNVNWLASTTADDWFGVGVSSNHVVNLSLPNNQLNGSIPASFGNLTLLTNLSFNNNQLSGSLPTELGALTNLTEFWLYSNHLTGSIPSSLGNLSKVRHFYLEGNHLVGRIPSTLGNLTDVEYLVLMSNYLTGDVPTSLMGLAKLTNLGLDYNYLCVPQGYPDPGNPMHMFLEAKNPGWDETQEPSLCLFCFLPVLKK